VWLFVLDNQRLIKSQLPKRHAARGDCQNGIRKYSCSDVDSADTYGRMIASHDKWLTDPNTKKSSDWLLTSDDWFV